MKDLEALLQDARRHGARAAEVLSTASTRVDLRVAGRGSPHREGSEEAQLIVRCWLEGGRSGESTGHPEQASALVERALREAAQAPEDPFSGPIRRAEMPSRGLGVDDQRHEQLTDEDRIEVVVTNARAVARLPTGLSTSFWYRDTRTLRRYANTHGVQLELSHTTYEAGGALDARVGGDRLTLREHIAGRAFASIACLPFGASLAQRLAALSKDGPPLAGPIRVLLPPRATGKMFGWLATLLDGRQGTFLSSAREEPQLHRRLHLVDDGALPGGLRSRGFDDRGVTPVPLVLLREGRVAERFLDPETARRRDTRPTGHCWPDGLRPSNLLLNSGMRSMNAILSEQTELVFEVDDLDDLSGIDPATGDLDLRVDGVVFDKQKPVGALRGARLCGNLVEALRQVAAVASDTDRILHVDAPGLFVDGFVVKG